MFLLKGNCSSCVCYREARFIPMRLQGFRLINWPKALAFLTLTPPTPQFPSLEPPPHCPLTHLREDGRRPADPSPQNTAHSPGERGHTRYRMDNSYALAYAALAAWLTSGLEERRWEEHGEELVLSWIRIQRELILIVGARLSGWSWVSSASVLLQGFVLSAADSPGTQNVLNATLFNLKMTWWASIFHSGFFKMNSGWRWRSQF